MARIRSPVLAVFESLVRVKAEAKQQADDSGDVDRLKGATADAKQAFRSLLHCRSSWATTLEEFLVVVVAEAALKARVPMKRASGDAMQVMFAEAT